MPQNDTSIPARPPGQAALSPSGPSSSTLFNMTSAMSSGKTLSGTPAGITPCCSKPVSRSSSQALVRNITYPSTRADDRTINNTNLAPICTRSNTLTSVPTNNSRTSTRPPSPYPETPSPSTPLPPKLPYLRRRISSTHAIYILYTLSFLSAALDAASFTAWTAFLNMQTGNTIFLALGASGQPYSNPFAWITALGSIATFIFASYIFGLLARLLGPRTRLSLGISFAVQAACTLLAAILIHVGYIPVPSGRLSPAEKYPGVPEPRELAAIVPLAFAAAGQVGATRELGYPLVPTLVLTTIYADAFRDTKIMRFGKQRGENPVRSKMLITIVVFVLGAITGGWVSRSSVGMGAVVWAGVAWRVVVAGLWLLWKWEEEIPVEGQQEARASEEDADDEDDRTMVDEERGRGRQRSRQQSTQMNEKRKVSWVELSQQEKEMREERDRDRQQKDDEKDFDVEAQRKASWV